MISVLFHYNFAYIIAIQEKRDLSIFFYIPSKFVVDLFQFWLSKYLEKPFSWFDYKISQFKLKYCLKLDVSQSFFHSIEWNLLFSRRKQMRKFEFYSFIKSRLKLVNFVNLACMFPIEMSKLSRVNILVFNRWWSM